MATSNASDIETAKGAVRVSVAIAALLLMILQDVVLALLDRFRAKEVAEVVTTGMSVGPVLDGAEHLALDLDVVVASCGVMESPEDIVDDFFDWNVGVLPGVEDAGSDV